MKSETRSFYEQAVRRAIACIVASLDGALDLSELARQAALSPLHFHHVFRGMAGETPLELHRRLRLERAAHQLANGDSPVTRIAFGAGYETHESFTRAFRRAFAVSPSEFRARARRPACAEAQPPRLATRSGIHFSEDDDGQLQPFHTGGHAMQVSIEHGDEITLATVCHVGPYNTIGTAFARLGEIAGPAGLFALRGARMIAVYHDDPESTPAAELRSEAGISVPTGTSLPKELSPLGIPAGNFARTTHVGPYATLGDTWARLMGEWLPGSGRRVRDGVSFEVYVSDMKTTPESELRTDIYVPID